MASKNALIGGIAIGVACLVGLAVNQGSLTGKAIGGGDYDYDVGAHGEGAFSHYSAAWTTEPDWMIYGMDGDEALAIIEFTNENSEIIAYSPDNLNDSLIYEHNAETGEYAITLVGGSNSTYNSWADFLNDAPAEYLTIHADMEDMLGDLVGIPTDGSPLSPEECEDNLPDIPMCAVPILIPAICTGVGTLWAIAEFYIWYCDDDEQECKDRYQECRAEGPPANHEGIGCPYENVACMDCDDDDADGDDGDGPTQEQIDAVCACVVAQHESCDVCDKAVCDVLRDDEFCCATFGKNCAGPPVPPQPQQPRPTWDPYGPIENDPPGKNRPKSQVH